MSSAPKNTPEASNVYQTRAAPGKRLLKLRRDA